MILHLVRHGIAIDRDDPACPPETERPLTKEGMERTREAMGGLLRLGVRPGVILTSPLVRAVQTARLAAKALSYPPERIVTTACLEPDRDAADLLEELIRLAEKSPAKSPAKSTAKPAEMEVLCCGHAPNLDEVIAFCSGAPETYTSLKKAGLASLEIDPARPGRGLLLWLLPPKVLRELLD